MKNSTVTYKFQDKNSIRTLNLRNFCTSERHPYYFRIVLSWPCNHFSQHHSGRWNLIAWKLLKNLGLKCEIILFNCKQCPLYQFESKTQKTLSGLDCCTFLKVAVHETNWEEIKWWMCYDQLTWYHLYCIYVSYPVSWNNRFEFHSLVSSNHHQYQESEWARIFVRSWVSEFLNLIFHSCFSTIASEFEERNLQRNSRDSE